jgi:hypothetical protein
VFLVVAAINDWAGDSPGWRLAGGLIFSATAVFFFIVALISWSER